MKQDHRIVQLNKEIKANAATIVIAAVLLYVVISVITSLGKKSVTIYQVSKGDISNDITLEGLAIRNEVVVNTTNSGYICYYITDGEKVKKDSTVCTIDQTGELSNSVKNTDDSQAMLSQSDYTSIRNLLSSYKSTYSDVTFYNAYSFETNANNKIFELMNEIMMQQAGAVKSGVATVNAPDSGLVTYYIDGYENYEISDAIKASDFDKAGYDKKAMKSGDMAEAGAAVVKIIPSEEWNIVAPITDDQLADIEGNTYVTFRINNSNFKITMPYTIIQGADGKYINIAIDKYMSNYLSQRFVSVEIVQSDDSGLKIPESAIVEKNVYKIPLSYLSAGSNQTMENRINIQRKDEKGNETIQQMKPRIYKTDEKYAYIDPDGIEDSDVLLDISSNETIAASLLEYETLTGIYFANQGIAEFRQVSVIKTIDEFVLIDGGDELKAYDHIVLNASEVSENQVIY
mgnify:CR=1 FL=1